MLKNYWVWISIMSFIFIPILAIIKLSKDVPNDTTFIIFEWILALLFYMPILVNTFKGRK